MPTPAQPYKHPHNQTQSLVNLLVANNNLTFKQATWVANAFGSLPYAQLDAMLSNGSIIVSTGE